MYFSEIQQSIVIQTHRTAIYNKFMFYLFNNGNRLNKCASFKQHCIQFKPLGMEQNIYLSMIIHHIL